MEARSGYRNSPLEGAQHFLQTPERNSLPLSGESHERAFAGALRKVPFARFTN
jgi:hypothetical protein